MKKRIRAFVSLALSVFLLAGFSLFSFAQDAVTGTYLVTAGDGLALYADAAASTNFRTIVPQETYINVAKVEGGFGYTVYDSVYGWVDLSSGARFVSSKPTITGNAKTDGVKGITVTSLPDKLVYVEGEESADIAGLEVSLVYNDENSTKLAVTGYTVSFPSLNSYGKKTVEIYYGGYKTYYNINVVKVPVTGISVTLPDKTSYVQGEAVSFDGLSVTAYYSDGRNGGKGVLLDESEYTVSGVSEGDNTLLAGNYAVTVTYKYPEISSVFHIYVSEKKVTSLRITKAPSDLNLYSGQTFNTADFELTATYDNGLSETITDFDIEYENTQVGEHTARIYYMGKYVAFDYEVYEVYDVSIAIGDTTAVGSYVGLGLDFSELHVYLVYNSGDRQEVSDYELDYDIDADTAGQYPVTVTYNGYTAQFSYTVADRSEVRIGDVNGDSKVTVADARLVLRYSARLETFDEAQMLAADVNADSKVDISDARKILRVSVGLESFS